MCVMGTLLFDLDDTLISDTRDAWAALDEVCTTVEVDTGARAALVDTVVGTARATWASDRYGGALAHELGISGVEALYSDLGSCHERVRVLAATQHEYKQRVWCEALAAHGHDVTAARADQLIDAFRAVRGDHVTVYDEVDEVLTELAGSHRLGIITNGPTDLQKMKLAATGLADLFGVVVISGELGWGKPQVAPFAHAMAALDAASESTTMLGDNVSRDVVGARAAGIGAVWVTRPELDFALDGKGDTDPDPDNPLATLVDLRPLLTP